MGHQVLLQPEERYRQEFLSINMGSYTGFFGSIDSSDTCVAQLTPQMRIKEILDARGWEWERVKLSIS